MFQLLIISALVGHGFGSVFLPNDSQYCDRQDLCSWEPHINCNNDHELKCAGTTPVENDQYAGRLYTFSTKEKRSILKWHNLMRANLAKGNLTGFPTAAKMNKVRWDDELEESAILNAKSCAYLHDCHNTDKWPNAAQNIGFQTIYGDDFDVMQIVANTILGWYEEHKYSNAGYMTHFDSLPSLEHVHEHFATLVKEDNDRIGCAALISKQIFNSNEFNRIDTVCNYNHLLMTNEVVYEAGAPVSKCPNGADTKFINLCRS